MTDLPTTCPRCGNDSLDRTTDVSYRYMGVQLSVMLTCWQCRYWWKYEAVVEPDWELKDESDDFD